MSWVGLTSASAHQRRTASIAGFLVVPELSLGFSVFFVRAGRGLGFGRRETVARLIETGVALADACVVYVCVRP